MTYDELRDITNNLVKKKENSDKESSDNNDNEG